jgi:protein gp37
MSAIEWTDATWNPATGCTKISSGCKECYASTLSLRLKAMKQQKYKNGFEYTEHVNEIDKPLHWKKPRKIFVNSMSDVFHEKATDNFISAIFDTMMRASHHIYQVLTKRPERMRDFVSKYISVHGGMTEIPNHIWLGTSVENQQVTNRINYLKEIPCIRFVSFEPLLGEIETDLNDIHWAIVGGESGRNFRDVIKEEWVLKLKQQCRNNNTAFFFKQWGGNYPKEKGDLLLGKQYHEYPIISALQKFGDVRMSNKSVEC